jgi:hypothetical protein
MGIALEFDLSTALSVQIVRLMSKLGPKTWVSLCAAIFN